MLLIRKLVGMPDCVSYIKIEYDEQSYGKDEKKNEGLYFFDDIIENIMNLHPNTLNNIDIKYRKYIIHSLINRKSKKFLCRFNHLRLH